jgi:hypothetical protein
MSDYNEDLFGLDSNGQLGLSPEDAIRHETSKGQRTVVTLFMLARAVSEWKYKLSDLFPKPLTSWFSRDGMECEILRVSGGGWQKGKLRFRLEFIPDNPAAFEKPKPTNQESSPLDDLRIELDLDKQ